MAINNSLLYVGQIGCGGVSLVLQAVQSFSRHSVVSERPDRRPLVLREDFRQNRRRRPDVRPFHLLFWRANIHLSGGGDGSGGSVTVDDYS